MSGHPVTIDASRTVGEDSGETIEQNGFPDFQLLVTSASTKRLISGSRLSAEHWEIPHKTRKTRYT